MCIFYVCYVVMISFQVTLSVLVQLATINNQVSSEALDVLLDLLSSLHGKGDAM